MGIVVAALVLSTASAAADTIHLEVSPTNPPRGGPATITATGEASSAGEHIQVGSSGSYPCPSDWYPGPPLGNVRECQTTSIRTIVREQHQDRRVIGGK